MGTCCPGNRTGQEPGNWLPHPPAGDPRKLSAAAVPVKTRRAWQVTPLSRGLRSLLCSSWCPHRPGPHVSWPGMGRQEAEREGARDVSVWRPPSLLRAEPGWARQLCVLLSCRDREGGLPLPVPERLHFVPWDLLPAVASIHSSFRDD